MIKSEKFWEDEREAPLMQLNRHFLKYPVDPEIFVRTSKWLSVLPDLQLSTLKKEEECQSERIILLDAERTFLGNVQRQKLIKVLNSFKNEFQTYHQGLSYIAGFLLLTIEEDDVVRILRHLNSTNYWKHEAVQLAIDAYVFEHLMNEFYPKLNEHLIKNRILPETYCQKWFAALCVNVLPFEALFQFIENLLFYGTIYLFQFALSLAKHIQNDLLETNNSGTIYQYLRLDSSLAKFRDNAIGMAIVNEALSYNLATYDFEQLRKQAYDEKLKARMEAAKQCHQQHADTDTDTESESEDEDDSLECQLCNNLVPDYVCIKCNKFICDRCSKRSSEHTCSREALRRLDEESTDVNSIVSNINKLNIK